MKHLFITNKSLLLGAAIAVSMASCGKLDPSAQNAQAVVAASADAPVPAPSLSSVYNQLNQFVGQGNWFAMNEHTTDELMGPTRGTDWDDFGTWRKLHLHTWDGSHNQVNDTWNGLQSALSSSTLLAESATASAADKNEAKFLRAFYTYQQIDLFGVVQHRPATALSKVLPDVYTRSQAIDYLIAELTAVIPNLSNYTPATRNKASKEAAQFLLAKALLNKAVYKADPTAPGGPYNFLPADMTQVCTLVNSIAANAALAVDNNYWDNFVWDNGSLSNENIFVRKNADGINMVWATCMGNHYNMPPDGWNGFTTLSDFYNSFESVDDRRQKNLAGFTNLTGRPAGFLVGQQQGPSGKTIGNPLVNLQDRSGNPLIFTPDASLFFSTESKGIRTNKYPLNPAEMNGGGWGSTNDYPFMRFSDARLMKAEAILRGGTDPAGETPMMIVTSVRTKRGVAAPASVDLNTMLAERGRELYLEAMRRNDLIRFGKFNDPVIERSVASAKSKVVFPIPNIALSSNPKLSQNAGY